MKNQKTIKKIIENFKTMEVYGPSDDPDGQTLTVLAHKDILIKLKYYSKSIEDRFLKKEISLLDENIENVYDVFDSRSRLEPIIDELQEYLESEKVYQDKSFVDAKVAESLMKPFERVALLEKIGLFLQQEMTTSDINLFLSGYDVEFEPEEMATSKKIYVKNILSKESERVIIRIAKDLGLHEDSNQIDINLLTEIDNAYVFEQIEKCNSKIESEDFDGAITNARTLVETICIHILDELKVEHDTKGDLTKLYKIVSIELKMRPELYSTEGLKQITSGFVTIVNGLASLRNDLGDSHGKSKDKIYKPQRRHALLAVNSARTISEYLISSLKCISK